LLKTIAYIYQSDYPWEVRIEKIAASLSRFYRVIIFASNPKRKPQFEQLGENIWVSRFQWTNRQRLNQMLSADLPFNVFWSSWLMREGRKHSVNLFIARDLPLQLPAIRVARRLNVPIIFDMAENYPAAVQAWGKQHIGHYISRNAMLVSALEKFCVRRVQHIWVVVEEQVERLQKLGIASDNISIVHNTPLLGNAPSQFVENVWDGTPPLKLIYVGLISYYRGLDIALRALARLPSPRNIELTVVGDGPDFVATQQLANELQVNECVKFRGWLPHDKAMEEIQRAHIGVVTHHANPFIQTTQPNKIFDYMLFGKPVICSNVAPLRRVVEQAHAGFVLEHNSPEELSRLLKHILQHPEELTLRGRNGRKAVEEIYNWGKEEAVILQTIERLLKNNTR
jgi:glycosyltransferase involved in cell wall biosynthesis